MLLYGALASSASLLRQGRVVTKPLPWNMGLFKPTLLLQHWGRNNSCNMADGLKTPEEHPPGPSGISWELRRSYRAGHNPRLAERGEG